MSYTQEDFETIYRATVTQVSKHVLFKVQNLEDAQDLVQDIYYALYRHMQHCQERIENPQAYLIQMANNELTKYYHSKLRRPVTLIDDEMNLIESLPDEIDLETEVLNSVTSQVLWDEINKLSDLDKTLLIARYRYDMSYIDISKQTNLPESTIKSRVYNALEGLKKKFQK